MASATFEPGSTPDTTELALDLAVLLFDAYTGARQLLGSPTVSLAGSSATPYRKPGESTYLFFGVPAGSYTVQVRSPADRPYYLPADIPVTLPMPDPLWPAVPDASLADPSKPLDDPTQPAAYRAQRALAGMVPATAYPYPAGATLVRGAVTSGGAPLLGATVLDLGGGASYVTGADGMYALPLTKLVGPDGRSALLGSATLRASHPIHPDVTATVAFRRGATSALNIDMGP